MTTSVPNMQVGAGHKGRTSGALQSKLPRGAKQCNAVRLSRVQSRPAPGAGSRRSSVAVHASAVGDAQWFMGQGAAAAIILGGFWLKGDLQAIFADLTKNEKEDGQVCPTCQGTGKTECACQRWSSDGEGCGTCNYTGMSPCPSCKGGGKGVRILMEIPVEEYEQEYRRTHRTPDDDPYRCAGVSPAAAPPCTSAIDRSSIFSAHAPRRAGPAEAAERPLQGALLGELGGTGLVEVPQFYGVMEPPSKTPGVGRGPSEHNDEYYAQSGEAIRTLREDYPALLVRDPRWSIYRDDIGFLDESNVLGAGVGGLVTNLEQYKRVFKALRTISAVLFSSSSLRVQRIWSPLGSDGARTIRVRWSLKGKLRLGLGVRASHGVFEGISEYKLDAQGYIYQHTITDLDWDVAELKERVRELSRSLSLGQRVRTPVGGQFIKRKGGKLPPPVTGQ